MGKERINGVFGMPKSLRNKFSKASDQLAEDAQAMEARLNQLKVVMLDEKQKRDAELPVRHAGNRWRSSQQDRGSIKQYARDIQQKTQGRKGKSEITGLPGGAKNSKLKTNLSRTIPSTATVEQWSVSQVIEWLTTIGLEDYHSGFEFHQVTGKILLDLTFDEYKHIGIFKLSARNRLLAEVEHIRTQEMTSRNKSHKSGGIDAVESVNLNTRDNRHVSSSSTTKMHWSHVPPLSNNAVASGDEQGSINPADRENEETASHALLMNALLKCSESDSSANLNQEGDEWVNPVFNRVDFTKRENQQEGGDLLEGSYNEEQAHNSFQEALLAWRNEGMITMAVSVTEPVKQVEIGCMSADKQSCWQCYRVVQVENLLHDEHTDKSFCSLSCQESYRNQYARFYKSEL